MSPFIEKAFKSTPLKLFQQPSTFYQSKFKIPKGIPAPTRPTRPSLHISHISIIKVHIHQHPTFKTCSNKQTINPHSNSITPYPNSTLVGSNPHSTHRSSLSSRHSTKNTNQFPIRVQSKFMTIQRRHGIGGASGLPEQLFPPPDY